MQAAIDMIYELHATPIAIPCFFILALPPRKLRSIAQAIATGGTMQAAIDMIYELHATPIAIACAMDLSFLGGSASIKKQGIPFYAATEYQS